MGPETVPALAAFRQAAPHVGAPSGPALRRRFERGIYPKRFLVQLTPRIPGVDLHALLAWIRAGSPSLVQSTEEIGS